MRAISLGRVYVTTVHQAAGAPLLDPCVTVEDGGAGRRGRGVAILLPWGRMNHLALVLGIWR